MTGNKNTLLSVCCLSYNHAKFIADNIRSVWRADCKDIEIIAVDDGSKDNSGEILKQLQKESPVPMTVILQKNTGNIGHNFNVALKQAKGQFITFMSLDDVLKSDVIAECIRQMIQNPKLAFIASGKIQGIDNNGKLQDNIPALRLATMENPTVQELLELEYSDFGAFYIQGSFFRKEIIDAVGGFDEDMTGDDIVLRTKVFRYIKNNQQWKFQILKKPICYYRRHSDNVSCNSLRQIKIVTEYLEKYWSDRKNPNILILWSLYAINNLSFQDALSLFSMNSCSAKLLQEPEIIEALESKVLVEHNPFRFIYSKKKCGDKRIIKLFSCIKFSYKKKSKK